MRTASGRGDPKSPAAGPQDVRFLPPSPNRSRGRFIVFMALLTVALAAVSLYEIARGPGGAPGGTARPANSPVASAGSAVQTTHVPVGGLPVITEVMTGNRGSITDGQGQYTDWIELYNPTDKAINLMGFALSDKLKKPRQCVLPAFLLAPHAFVIIYADGGASTKSELHASFRLGSSGTPLLLLDPNGDMVQSINVPEMKSDCSYAADMGDPSKWAVTDQCTPGFPNTDDGRAAYLQTRRAKAPVFIDEVMAGNTMTLRDKDGDYSDWLEIFNPSDKDVDLTGWGLSNKEGEPKRWVFPKTVIGAGKYLVVFLSGKDRAEAGKELHASFRVNAFKDTMLLSNFLGQIVSEVQISGLKDDASLGLAPGADAWQLFRQPTPGFANDGEGWLQFQPSLYADTGEPVVISEVMSGNSSTLMDQFNEYPDWIEFYNRSDKSMNLKGWGLTDKSDEPGRWKFPDITLQPHAYLIVFASGRNLTDAPAVSARKLHTDFTIGGSGGVLALTDPKGKIADRCFVPALPPGDTYGRAQGSLLFSYSTDPTPGAANAAGYPGMASDPVFSLKAGAYKGTQKVELTVPDPDAKIYYTTDGSTPTDHSALYTEPLNLTKTTAVRAIAYRDGFLPGRAVTQTYFIDAKHTLPVISISTTPKNLFDKDTGIYMPGPNADPNNYMDGANFYKNTEVPASFEVYDENGKRVFNQDIGLSMAGGLGLIKNQKTFAIHARGEYGQSTMNYKFFDDRPYTQYKSLVLRTNRDKSKIRESVIFGLVDGQVDVVTQAYKPYVVYINGQYWGVYNLMEKRNKYMVAQHEGASDPDHINILKGSGGIISNGTNTEYKSLVKYVKNHDMSQKANFDYVAARLDTDSFMDVMINLIYIANNDYYNMQYYQVPGGKWKQILYDTELTFQVAGHKTLEARMGDNCNSDLFNGLLKYKPWKDKFIGRFAWTIKVIYNPARVNAAIDKAAADVQGEIAAMHAKFGDTATVDEWNAQIRQMHTFANNRPAAMVSQLKMAFALTDAQKEMLDDAIR